MARNRKRTLLRDFCQGMVVFMLFWAIVFTTLLTYFDKAPR